MLQSNVPDRLRPIIAGAAATAGLAMSFSTLATVAEAQTAGTGAGSGAGTAPGTAAGAATVLDPVRVGADRPADTGNVNAKPTGISRLPDTVKDTPRVVNVVPEEIIEQQDRKSVV